MTHPCFVWQKPAQHCKAIILQLEKKKAFADKLQRKRDKDEEKEEKVMKSNLVILEDQLN